jgi:hypothetical protein
MTATIEIKFITYTFLGIAVAAISIWLLLEFFVGRRQRRRKRELAEKHTRIFLIIRPTEGVNCIAKATSAEILVGDFGWEAQPIREDGLIYLHGLNDRWQVVWYTGFRAEDVEFVAMKPHSHYYLYPWWFDTKQVSKCPFPVQRFEYGSYPDAHLSFAVDRGFNWAQYGDPPP